MELTEVLEAYADRVTSEPDPDAATYAIVIARHPRYFGRRLGGWKGTVRHYYRHAEWAGGGLSYISLGPWTAMTRRGLLRWCRFHLSPHKPDIVPRAVPVFEVPWSEVG